MNRQALQLLRDRIESLETALATSADPEQKFVLKKRIEEARDAKARLESAGECLSKDDSLLVVPKGLRSYDQHDAGFFLRLLPGPYRDDGLPESLHFWKTRIEETDADATFTVGLIYGPSGCGKSSLVKAGLLPCLSSTITSVYVTATPDDTERKLVRELNKRGGEFTAARDLGEAASAVDRLPRGNKVLIVLDQFEQWLHGRHEGQYSELADFLSKCDGGRLQCLLMIRDDFCAPLNRFTRMLGVRLREDANMALVDLFDVHHARRVLTLFGRAYGVLPIARDLSTDQTAFIDRAVDELAQQGRVICVRLALFADLVKYWDAWEPRRLTLKGGFQGVGVEFLEGAFSTQSAPEPNRMHARAAQAVLDALLPDQGLEIKGHRKSRAELLAVSGYDGRADDFADLLAILEDQTRLITPVFIEDDASEGNGGDESGKHYQLTHDYMVPALREWLTLKINETRRGRAQLKLVERTKLWSHNNEVRQLPSLPELINFWMFTRNRTEPQQNMLKAAAWFHVTLTVLWCILLGIVVLAASIGWTFTPRSIAGQLARKSVIISPRGNRFPGEYMARADGHRDVETKKLGKGKFEERDLQEVGRLMSYLSRLTYIDFDDLATLETAELDGYDSLKKLELDGCERLITVRLKALAELEELTLANCIRLQELEGLSETPGLKILDLSGCKAFGRATYEYPDPNPNKRIARTPDGLLRSLPLNLEELRLGGWDKVLRQSNVNETVGALLKSTRVKVLSLAGCECISLGGLSEMGALDSLNLSHCVIVTELDELDKCRLLKSLTVRGLGGDTSQRLLEGLESLKLTTVRSLDLSYGTFSTLEFLPQWQCIEELKLRGCGRLESLQGITNLSGLRKLYLDDCTMLDDLTPLSSLKLERLTLRGCALSSLNGLQEMQTLSVLDLTDATKKDKDDRPQPIDLTAIQKLELKAINLSGLDVRRPEHRRLHLEALQSSASASTLELLAWRGIMSTRDGDLRDPTDPTQSAKPLSAQEFLRFKELIAIDFGDRVDDYTEDPPSMTDLGTLAGLNSLRWFCLIGFSPEQTAVLKTRLRSVRTWHTEESGRGRRILSLNGDEYFLGP